MNSKILCHWLGIVDWPPDHHTLLDLEPGERDVARVEQRVQERMAKLRTYQLSHPEEATEGMNRLAQAFICLTESLSKSQHVEQPANGTAAPETYGAAMSDTHSFRAPGHETGVDWQQAPPPIRATVANGATEPAAPAPAAAAGTHAAPFDPIIQLATESTEARRALGSLAAVLERIHQTRQFILAWNQAGKYLSNPGKRLTRAAEEADLTRRLNKIFELTADFPKIVGHPGLPGYRVMAMARLEMTAQMFKMLDESQRAALARDWDAGYRVLLAHRRFLRGQFKLWRARGPLSLVLNAIRVALNDHPAWVLAGMCLAVLLCLFLYRKVFF
jgi:hypothetical protein